MAAPSRRWLVAWLLTAGLTIGARTLGRLLRAAGYHYKRVRRCLRAQRPEARFRAAQRLLDRLRRHQRAGRLRLWYTDECRFSRQAPVSHAWQPRGARACPVPAVRGKGGYSLLGCWWAPDAAAAAPTINELIANTPTSDAPTSDALPVATTDTFHAWVSETAFTAELWVQAVDAWLLHQTGPTLLVLDNASIHRARLVVARQPAWREKGLQLFFIPPYSPELNHIENLWRHFKHEWLAPADYQTEQTLLQRIKEIALQINQKCYVTSG